MSRGSSSLHGRRAAQQPARSLIRPYRAGDPRDPGSENLMRSPHYPSAAGAGPLETTSAKASRRAGRRGPARRPPQGTPGARAQTEHWANWPQRGSHTPPIQGEHRSPRAEGTRPPPATKREERANEGALVRAPKPGGEQPDAKHRPSAQTSKPGIRIYLPWPQAARNRDTVPTGTAKRTKTQTTGRHLARRRPAARWLIPPSSYFLGQYEEEAKNAF